MLQWLSGTIIILLCFVRKEIHFFIVMAADSYLFSNFLYAMKMWLFFFFHNVWKIPIKKIQFKKNTNKVIFFYNKKKDCLRPLNVSQTEIYVFKKNLRCRTRYVIKSCTDTTEPLVLNVFKQNMEKTIMKFGLNITLIKSLLLYIAIHLWNYLFEKLFLTK